MLSATVSRLLQRPFQLKVGGEAVAAVVAGTAGVLSIYGCSSVWAQGLLGWLAVEAIFYGVQCWRYALSLFYLVSMFLKVVGGS